MKYELKVSLSEREYYDFNKFHMNRSPYGKRNRRAIYIIALVMAILIMAMNFIVEGFNIETFLFLIPYLLVICLILLLVGPLSLLVLKMQIALMKKQGKMPYEETSVIELYEDYFVEVTDKSRNEIKYTGAEGIMISQDGSIYIYMNSLMAYILPVSCFESDKMREEISGFLLERIEKLK